MPDDLNSNTIAASVITDLIKASFHSVCDGASTIMRSSWQKVFEDFAPYMEEAYLRNKHVRILCQKENDVDLYEVYVNSTFSNDNGRFTDEDLMYKVREGKNLVIVGNGGAGKTFFMRHLWLTLFANPESRTPIFIELRKLNELSTLELETFIRNSISTKGKLTKELFEYFCETGRFAFVLDGYDEVAHENRASLQNQILNMSSKFPQCSIVVSSRHEPSFAGWQSFEVYESDPFNLSQVKELVRKVPFDKDAKRLFLKQLNSGFFKQNEGFLSNPLLAIMMMMTFRENMEIPKRMNVFYDQAFSTLFQWHDATKAYSRHKVLDIDRFRKSFSVFCLLSYYDQVYEFSVTQIIDYIGKSNKITGFKIKPEEILKDYEQSVNLIRQDGLRYIFIHRSFQEYFAAYALVAVLPKRFSEIIPNIKERGSDTVLQMCYEMNKELVISDFVEPGYAPMAKEGIFDLKYDDKCFCLEMIGTKYNYTYDREGEKKNRLASIHFNLNEEYLFFFDNVRKLIRPLDNGVGFIYDTIFDHGLFRAFPVSKELMTEGLSVTIYFEAGVPYLQVVSIDSKLPVSDAIFKSFEGELAAIHPLLMDLNHQLYVALDEVNDWCRREIASSKKRGRSLDHILGLT